MTSKKTVAFIDAGVLIAAARGKDELHMKAMAILDDPNRIFSASSFVRLEVLPKAVYHKNKDEAEFYHAFFEAVERWADDVRTVVDNSYDHAVKHGLRAMDALHVASAVATQSDELITTERPASPLNQVSAVKIVSIKR